jgi:hypothetical protein
MDCLPTPDEFLFQTYITAELRLWAASLNVTDEAGFPVIPYNSNDVVANFPPYGQQYIFSAAAILDAIGCQAVLRQVTFLTRLRSLFQNCSINQMLSVIRTTDEMPLLGISLLQALLVNGFSRLLDSTKTDVLLGIILRHTSIAKADVERRLIQFTCLLHKHFQSPKTTHISNLPNLWK